MEPEQRRDRVLLSLEHLFRCASAQAPLLIVVDDLHWADALSVIFLQRLLDAVESGEMAGRRALVLILSRPADVGSGRRAPRACPVGDLDPFPTPRGAPLPLAPGSE
ncbi:MAG: AAA family ATPase [Ardenticatenia bacterium]|nr:AAA family ATPase [Ardenticatenia bacterium]